MKSLIKTAFVSIALAGACAHADISFTPTIASDYDFRGISLSARKATYQGELDFSFASGWKGYVFVSNTDLGPAVDTSTEVDLVGGYGGSIGSASWDAGIVYYTYPTDTKFNYPEAWVGLSKSFNDGAASIGGKLWYSNDYAAAKTSATYVELNGSYGLPAGFGLVAHVGHSDGKYWDDFNGGGYVDYNIGVTKSFGKIAFALKYIDGSDLIDCDNEVTCGDTGVNSTDKKIVLSVSTTLPWKD